MRLEEEGGIDLSTGEVFQWMLEFLCDSIGHFDDSFDWRAVNGPFSGVEIVWPPFWNGMRDSLVEEWGEGRWKRWRGLLLLKAIGYYWVLGNRLRYYVAISLKCISFLFTSTRADDGKREYYRKTYLYLIMIKTILTAIKLTFDLIHISFG